MTEQNGEKSDSRRTRALLAPNQHLRRGPEVESRDRNKVKAGASRRAKTLKENLRVGSPTARLQTNPQGSQRGDEGAAQRRRRGGHPSRRLRALGNYHDFAANV